jgi:hypothetical protein
MSEVEVKEEVEVEVKVEVGVVEVESEVERKDTGCANCSLLRSPCRLPMRR